MRSSTWVFGNHLDVFVDAGWAVQTQQSRTHWAMQCFGFPVPNDLLALYVCCSKLYPPAKRSVNAASQIGIGTISAEFLTVLVQTG